MTNILFVCKHNRFRSKIAEAIFNKLNKSKRFRARSAGLIRGSPVNYFQKSVCINQGIKLRDPVNGISTKLLKWQGILVIVADDVPPSIFINNRKYGKKLIVWKIPDAKSNERKEIINIIKLIEKKVKLFVEALG